MRIEYTKRALRLHKHIPGEVKNRIRAFAEQVKRCTSADELIRLSRAENLSGFKGSYWRVKVGTWRLIFSVEGDTVVVEYIGPRDMVYKRIRDILR